MRKRRGLAIFLVGFMLLGVLFLIFSVKQLVDTRRFLAHAVGADAQVVDIARHIESRRQGSGKNERWVDVPYYYPVVRFVTPLEEVIQFDGSDGSDEPGVIESASRYGSSTTRRIRMMPGWTQQTAGGAASSSSLLWAWASSSSQRLSTQWHALKIVRGAGIHGLSVDDPVRG